MKQKIKIIKKLILTVAILLVGTVSCSKSEKDKKIEEKKNVNTSSVSVSTSKEKSKYEVEMLQRMEMVKKEVQPALDSGVTADMSNAAQKLEESWETEMKKVYELLLSELPENEKIKLQKEQEKWDKGVNEELAKEDKEEEEGTIERLTSAGTSLGSTEDRALELAKRYDELRSKK